MGPEYERYGAVSDEAAPVRVAREPTEQRQYDAAVAALPNALTQD